MRWRGKPVELPSTRELAFSPASSPAFERFLADLIFTSSSPACRFAKKAWAWTTVPFVAHALLHPPRATTATSRLRSLTKYAVATAYWAVLTLWAVGPSLFERTMVYTGGECSVVVPRSACASGEVDCSAGVAVGKGALIRIPQEFCHVRLPSAGLAARLSESLKAAGEDGAAGAFHRETVGEWWASLHPRWSGGHDVSGHVFLLTLSAVLLLGEVWPTLVQLRRAGWDVGQVGLRAYVALTGAALVALWVFILSASLPSLPPLARSSTDRLAFSPRALFPRRQRKRPSGSTRSSRS